MTYVVNLADDPHFRFSADLLRSLHSMMTEYELSAWPGRWRPGLVCARAQQLGEAVMSTVLRQPR